MFNALHPTASSQRFNISYEFFPPKTPEMEAQLWQSVKRLEALKPHFVSVTYGAGGSTRERTHAIVSRIARETHMKPAAHLTCVSSSSAEIDDILHGYWDAGVRHIVALRGDPPTGVGTTFTPNPDGYARSCELVRGIRRLHDFEISVSTYPEGHPESASVEQDLDALRAKIDAGATRAITQFFFDNDIYFRFLDKARARGDHHPHRAGHHADPQFPSGRQFRDQGRGERAALDRGAFRGARQRPRDPRARRRHHRRRTGDGLARAGVDQFHFYTNNRADMVFAICHLLGVRPLREKVDA